MDVLIELHKERLVKRFYSRSWNKLWGYFFTSCEVYILTITFSYFCTLRFKIKPNGCEDAFLNGELNEEVYMEQPVGFIVKGQEKKVCKLKRSIYGLKHSSRKLYMIFHKEVMSFDFTMIDEDHCFYVKKSNGKFVILLFT